MSRLMTKVLRTLGHRRSMVTITKVACEESYCRRNSYRSIGAGLAFTAGCGLEYATWKETKDRQKSFGLGWGLIAAIMIL